MYLPRGRGGGYLLFFETRTRRPRSGERRLPRVCVCARFSFLSYFISRIFFLYGAARSKAHDLERGGMYGETRVNNDDSGY